MLYIRAKPWRSTHLGSTITGRSHHRDITQRESALWKRLQDCFERPSHARPGGGPRLRTGPTITARCVRTNLTCLRWGARRCQALSISYVNERAFQARLRSFWNQKNIPSWLPLTHHSRGGLEHDDLCLISLYARPDMTLSHGKFRNHFRLSIVKVCPHQCAVGRAADSQY
jgi:hypothetical protein